MGTMRRKEMTVKRMMNSINMKTSTSNARGKLIWRRKQRSRKIVEVKKKRKKLLLRRTTTSEDRRGKTSSGRRMKR
jgi:hypothetical protein